MTPFHPADIVSPKARAEHRLHRAIGNAPVVHTAQYRLLGVNQNPEQHRLDLTCFHQGQYVKAILEISLIDALQPFVGKTVWMEYSKTFSGLEPVLHIYRLGMVTKVQNPLLTYLPLWLDPAQQGLVGELVRLVNLLEAPYRELVQEVFRDDEMLEAFLDRPASLAFHHSIRGGLLAHTVEVALDCERACKGHPTLNASLVIASALLHDIGKCQEYQPCHTGFRRYRRSQTGTLEMHKIQGVRMLSMAAHRCQADPLMVSEICHVITAANGPEYMGLPRPKMAEAALFQSADGRSSSVNLFQTKNAPSVNWTPFGGQYRVPPSSPGLGGAAPSPR